MLFLLFQLGKDRYALEANRVVEVVPLVNFKKLPRAPNGVAGVFNYRGRPVPAVDLSQLTIGQPAKERLSTRIIVVNYPDRQGHKHLLGLVAEHATDVLRSDAQQFVESGIQLQSAPYLGPVLMDKKGPIQWLYEDRLLPEPVKELVLNDGLAAQDTVHLQANSETSGQGFTLGESP